MHPTYPCNQARRARLGKVQCCRPEIQSPRVRKDRRSHHFGVPEQPRTSSSEHRLHKPRSNCSMHPTYPCNQSVRCLLGSNRFSPPPRPKGSFYRGKKHNRHLDLIQNTGIRVNICKISIQEGPRRYFRSGLRMHNRRRSLLRCRTNRISRSLAWCRAAI